MLGLMPYIKGFFTPKLCGVRSGKPHRDLWDFVSASYEIEMRFSSVMIPGQMDIR